MIIGIVIHNIKNADSITENPIQFELKLNIGSTINNIFRVT